MEVKIQAAAVREAMEFLKGYVKSIKYLPIAENVLIVAAGENVVLTVTDGEAWARYAVKAEVETKGQICIPAEPLQLLAQSGIIEMNFHSGRPIFGTRA